MSSAPLLPVELIDVQTVVDTAIASLRGDVEETGAVISCDVLPKVRLASMLVAQLFQNLIGNAIKYRNHESPRIHITAQERGDNYLFSLKDNGIGIEKQHQESVFKPFKRLHGMEIEGTGMGLAVCQKIVERAGGRIWVESEPGQGSTFFFTLPC